MRIPLFIASCHSWFPTSHGVLAFSICCKEIIIALQDLRSITTMRSIMTMCSTSVAYHDHDGCPSGGPCASFVQYHDHCSVSWQACRQAGRHTGRSDIVQRSSQCKDEDQHSEPMNSIYNQKGTDQSQKFRRTAETLMIRNSHHGSIHHPERRCLAVLHQSSVLIGCCSWSPQRVQRIRKIQTPSTCREAAASCSQRSAF